MTRQKFKILMILVLGFNIIVPSVRSNTVIGDSSFALNVGESLTWVKTYVREEYSFRLGNKRRITITDIYTDEKHSGAILDFNYPCMYVNYGLDLYEQYWYQGNWDILLFAYNYSLRYLELPHWGEGAIDQLYLVPTPLDLELVAQAIEYIVSCSTTISSNTITIYYDYYFGHQSYERTFNLNGIMTKEVYTNNDEIVYILELETNKLQIEWIYITIIVCIVGLGGIGIGIYLKKLRNVN